MCKLRKTAALLLALSLSFVLAAPAFAAEDNPQRGVLSYTELITPQYEDAGLFIDGLAPVKKNGKWGYIDESGTVVIDFQYDYAWRFSEGYALVAKATDTSAGNDSEYDYTYYMEAEIGFIDRDNHYTALVDPAADYDSGWNPVPGPLTLTFHDVVFHYPNGDTDSSRFVPEEETWLFHNGAALLKAVDPESGYAKQFIYRADGTRIVSQNGIDLLGTPTGPLNEGLIPIREEGGRAGYVDVNGNGEIFLEEPFGPEITTDWGTDQSYRSIYHATSFNQGLAAAYQHTYDAATGDGTGLIGFLDKNYNWVIQPQYTDFYWKDTYRTCEIFGETGLASMADASGKWGAIDKSGATVIPFQYDLLGYVSGGLLLFKQGGKYGYLDAETCQTAIPAQYEIASNFGSLALAAVYDGTKAFLIDRNGNAVPGADVLDPSTYFIKNEDTGLYQTYEPDEYVVIEKNGKYGYGKLEYLPELPQQDDTAGWAYGEVVEAIEDGLVPVYLQNLYRQDITRAEFCDLMMRTVSEALGKNVEDLVLERTGKSLTALRQEYHFNDTTSISTVAAYALGIVQGNSDTTFNPYGQINRQEAAAMLARAARVLGLTAGTGAQFNDANTFADWAKSEITFVSGLVDPVTGNRVMNGVSSDRFGPTGTYTREQAVATALRLYHCAEKAIAP